MPAETLPLFPLRAVLFPGATVALRVFETRYIDMIRRCLRGDEGFGVVAIRRGAEVGLAETYRVGTVARVVDWATTADGLLGIEVLGGDRFRFEAAERAGDGLYVGYGVAPLVDAPMPLLAGQQWARELLATLRERDADRERVGNHDLDDANLVCWNLAQSLPLELHERQALLEIDELDRRFERLRASAAVLLEGLAKERTNE